MNAFDALAALPERKTMPRPEVAAFGEWDTTNLGDRGIHQGVQAFLSDCGCDMRSYGVSTLVPVQHNGTAIDMAPQPSARGGRIAMALGAVPSLRRTLRGIRQRMRMSALFESLEPARAVLVGGGALLTDFDLHFPQSLVELARYARRSGKPLLCLGCSMEGEVSARGERMVREFLAACDLVAVRDYATAARLTPALGNPPPVFGDFCLSESLALPDRVGSRDWGAIAINVSHLGHGWKMAQDRYEDALVALTNRLAGSSDACPGIRIFTTGVPEDARAAQRVMARIPELGAQLYLPGNLAQLSAMLGSSSLVISTRLHAAILAIVARVPVVGFSAEPKIRNFLATLGIRRYFHGLEDWPELADSLIGADYGAIYAEQRRALTHAPLWAERAKIRDRLQALCGAQPCM